jgi:type II secretory pathway component GspD/PulD (secretin)
VIALARAWQRIANGHRPSRRPHALVPSALMILGLAAGCHGEDFTPPNDQTLASHQKVAEAARERAAGHLNHARELCQQALLLVPASQEAREELARIDAIVKGRDQSPVPEEEHPASDDLKRQVALADARIAQDQSELLAAEGRSAEAAATLEPAIAALTEFHLQLSSEQIQELDRLKAVDLKLRELAHLESDDAKRQGRAQQLTAAQQAAEAQLRIHQSVLDERLSRIESIRHRLHLEMALEETRRLLVEYPAEPRVDKLFREILQEVHEQRRLSLEEQKIEARKEVMQSIQESMIPTGFDGMPVYPADFRARHQTLSGLEERPEVPLWKEALLDRLAKNVSVSIDNENGVDALKSLASATGINLVIDPQMQAGDAHPVTLKASDMRLEHVIDWITSELGTHWSLTNGAVYVGGNEDVTGVLSVYDIASLLFQGEDHAGKILGFAAGGALGKKNGLFQTVPEGKQTAPEDVVDLLQKSVSPDTWKNPNYGIQVHNASLFINAPPSVHELIKEFITAQEHQRSLQVRIDARWLEIDDSYIEEIGVDWGNLAQNSLLPGEPTNPSFYPNAGAYQENAFRSNQANLNNVLPPTSFNTIPAISGTGLNFSLARLGSTALNAVLTAVEREGRGRILESPSLVTLNGVQASCFFGTEIAYISTYNIVSSTLEPQIDVLNVGASLVVKPEISADHKYVTMEFRPALADVTLFTQILDAPRIFATPNATGFLGFVEYPIELPNVLLREVGTTIQVPDHGSLLVGGFDKTIDQQSASRIPFLGNIPFVGRLFGARGRYSQRSKLYLLATVSIITYDELEATQ